MEEIIKQGQQVFIHNYKQLPIVIKRGEGVYLYDQEGKAYLDFVAGIAVNALGYSHEGLKQALKLQVDDLLHCSNLYWNEASISAAKKLTALTGLQKVFFCNSGAEAVEAALKLARKYTKKFISKDRYEIIAMKNAFHGRTLGAVTVTGQDKYQKDLDPLLPGVRYADFNNIESVKANLNDHTCAIIVEPVQGEGGILPAEASFLKDLRSLCDREGLVLIFDEVQCGIGRTGYAMAYQYYQVIPDSVCMAKGLGSGVPVGAIAAKEEIAAGFEPGDHASTFGGNPLSASAVNVVLSELLEGGLLMQVREMSEYLKTGLIHLMTDNPGIEEVRGVGLMLGIRVAEEKAASIIRACLDKGLMLVQAGNQVIRFVPPLVVTKKDIDKALAILKSCL